MMIHQLRRARDTEYWNEMEYWPYNIYAILLLLHSNFTQKSNFIDRF